MQTLQCEGLLMVEMRDTIQGFKALSKVNFLWSDGSCFNCDGGNCKEFGHGLAKGKIWAWRLGSWLARLEIKALARAKDKSRHGGLILPFKSVKKKKRMSQCEYVLNYDMLHYCARTSIMSFQTTPFKVFILNIALSDVGIVIAFGVEHITSFNYNPRHVFFQLPYICFTQSLFST